MPARAGGRLRLRKAEENNQERRTNVAYVTMRQLLEAGVHFGHQTGRWNPKMKPYIFGARNGIHIIDLQQTVQFLRTAYDFVTQAVAKGGEVLFVGTKRQAADIIFEESQRCGQYFVNHRWLGGMLTNFQTIKKSIERYKWLEGIVADESINNYPKKEAMGLMRELNKLKRNLGGIKDMNKLPAVVFVVDIKKEKIAINEAQRLKIPIMAIVDTNCDPDGIDYLVPGNDDAIRAIRLISAAVADAVNDGLALREQRGGAPAEEVKMPKDMPELTVGRAEEQQGPEVVVIRKGEAPPAEDKAQEAAEAAEAVAEIEAEAETKGEEKPEA